MGNVSSVLKGIVNVPLLLVLYLIFKGNNENYFRCFKKFDLKKKNYFLYFFLFQLISFN